MRISSFAMETALRIDSIMVELGESGQFDAMVELSTFMGSSQEYFVREGDDVFNVEESNPMGKRIFDEGERVKVTFPAENVHVINKKD